MELILPSRQQAWRWPAALNFILGGLGSSFYLLNLLSLRWTSESRLVESLSGKLLGPALVLAGLAVLGLEARRPSRGRYLLSHLKRSWMSREVLAAALFATFALLDVFFPSAFLRWIAALGAGMFLFSQSFILYRAKGVAAWNQPQTSAVFISSSLLSGAGLLLITTAWGGGVSGRVTASMTLALLVIDLWAWGLYLGRRPEGQRRAVKSRKPISLMLTVGAGRLLPALLLVPLLTSAAEGNGGQTLLVAAGASVIAGCAVQKIRILHRDGYLREIALDRKDAG